MSAKTAPALRPSGDPITPVIIKSGGGGGGYGDPIEPGPVEIESSSIPFKETVTGRTWVSSQSTSTGRITRLEIEDGATSTHHRIEPSDQLASVTLKFGSAQFTAMESGVAADNNVVLLLTSPEVPFKMPEPVEHSGDWHSSSTAFSEPLTSVVLMVGGQQRLFYRCEHPGVTVRIKFEQI